MSSRFATESSVMREGDGGLLLPCDELNFREIFPFRSLAFFHFALLFPSTCILILFLFALVFVVFPHKDALPPLSLEVSFL